MSDTSGSLPDPSPAEANGKNHWIVRIALYLVLAIVLGLVVDRVVLERSEVAAMRALGERLNYARA